MKTFKSSAVLLVTLLFTSTVAIAQSVQSNAADSGSSLPAGGGGASPAVAEDYATNLYFMAGPTWLRVARNLQFGSAYLYGGTVGFGWRLYEDDHEKDKLQIDAGVVAGSAKNSGAGYSNSIDYVASLTTLTFNYCKPLSLVRQGMWELRFSPTFGVACLHTNVSESYIRDNTPVLTKGADGSVTIAGGIGMGITCHVSKRMLIDVGWRFVQVRATNHTWGYLAPLNTNSVTLSSGWKF